MTGDAHGWMAGICPVCLFLARTCPLPDHSLAINCERCGDFDLSEAAGSVLDSHPGPLDRQRLSEAVCDACMLTEGDRPMIDSITASALIGLVTICA